MTRSTRMFWVVLPLAIVATAAITVAITSVPWASTLRRLSAVGILINSRVTPWLHRDKPITQPPVLDHTVIIESTPEPIEPINDELAPEPVVPITLEPAVPVLPAPLVETAPAVVEIVEPREPVDYARLNQEVMHVADALDRFNQKLLRMIAQARASQRSVKPTPRAEEPIMPEGPGAAVRPTTTWDDDEATN